MNGYGFNLLLGISGGIAAYKVPFLIRILKKKEPAVNVKCVLTNNALSLVGKETLRTLTNNPVYSDNESSGYDMEHIRLAEWADAFCIVPATANTISKIANGIADNLLTTLALSFSSSPLIVIPAMNSEMWRKQIIQDNLQKLRDYGYRVLPVSSGPLACGVDDIGRMISVETIADAVMGYNYPVMLKGKKVLISSGATYEKIDPVRGITNLSSGRMGSALAAAAISLGADVTFVTAHHTFPAADGVNTIKVESALEMKDVLFKEFDKHDILVMAAAVSDYRVKNLSDEKIKRENKEELTIELEKNPDIIAELGKNKKGKIIVGFSLESSTDINLAKEKLKRKNIDFIVYNNVDDSLGRYDTSAKIIDRAGNVFEYNKVDKVNLAYEIFKTILRK